MMTVPAPLSQTVSRVLSLMHTEDPMDCAMPSGTAEPAYQGRLRWAEHIVLRAGHASYGAFLEEVERRTTPRWVYQSGLLAFQPEGN